MEELEEIVKEEIKEEKEPVSFKYYVSVRFKNAKKAYSFGCNDDQIPYGSDVVVETARGIELGTTISDVRDIIAPLTYELKPVLRIATEKDIEDSIKNVELAKEALVKCQECVNKLQLDMNLISAEYTLDRSKVIFVYVADERVDFRELLKDLAATFKCRIELRQIGPRDKAKMIGGIGPCGHELCCSRFMKGFDVVSINMAKNQMLALNIQKLSGQCGKLMCCLKFEDDVYKQLKVGLPKINSQVEYQGKVYRLNYMNVISREIRLDNRDESVTLTFEEALAANLKRPEHLNNNKPKKKEEKHD